MKTKPEWRHERPYAANRVSLAQEIKLLREVIAQLALCEIHGTLEYPGVIQIKDDQDTGYSFAFGFEENILIWDKFDPKTFAVLESGHADIGTNALAVDLSLAIAQTVKPAPSYE